MATLSNLDVNLFARTKTFDAPIKKSKAVFGGFVRNLKSFTGARLAGGFAAIAASAGGILAVGSAIRNVNEQFDNIDSMAKFADSVDATVQEMQALRLNAELTGTAAPTLDKGIQTWTRRLGEAKIGLGASAKAFADYNLNAMELAQLPLTQQLGIVADKINGQETAADKAAAAYALMGRQGQDLLTFFASGSDGIQQATDDINAFNAGLSRTDAANVELMNDSFTRLESLTTGLWQNIAAKAAPVMTALVEMFTDAARESEGWGGTIETAFWLLEGGVGMGLNAFEALSGAVNIWRGNLMQAITAAVGALELLGDGLSQLTGAEFDFGVSGLAAELQKEANAFYNEGSNQLARGLSGEAGREFSARLDEVKNRASEIAAAADAVTNAAPPEVMPIDWAAAGQTFLSEFNRQLETDGLVLGDDFKFGPKKDGENDVRERPSVAALTRGSSAAQSAINQTKSLEQVIKDQHRDEIDEMVNHGETLTEIRDQLQKPIGKRVQI